MVKLKDFEVTARPSKKEASSAFWSTSFMLFASDEETGAQRSILQATTPSALALNIMDWLDTLPLAEEFQGWSFSVQPVSDRWPAGFKAPFGQARIKQVREAA